MKAVGQRTAGLAVVAPPAARVAVDGSANLYPVHRIYCVGQNYREHAREMGASLRESPFFFSKPSDAVLSGPVIPFPPMTKDFHHEVELVVALGSGGVDLSPEAALSAVFGYAVGVDLTRRDLQAEAKQQGRPWSTAKGFDRSAPVSAIRMVGDSGHPASSAISLSVNNEIRQLSNTSDMTWSVVEIISELSRYFELHPGDLIFTGTPSGVAALQPGDRVHAEIEAVGELDFEVGSLTRDGIPGTL
jgi:fumarylpyruvate hydrolase